MRSATASIATRNADLDLGRESQRRGERDAAPRGLPGLWRRHGRRHGRSTTATRASILVTAARRFSRRRHSASTTPHSTDFVPRRSIRHRVRTSRIVGENYETWLPQSTAPNEANLELRHASAKSLHSDSPFVLQERKDGIETNVEVWLAQSASRRFAFMAILSRRRNWQATVGSSDALRVRLCLRHPGGEPRGRGERGAAVRAVSGDGVYVGFGGATRTSSRRATASGSSRSASRFGQHRPYRTCSSPSEDPLGRHCPVPRTI